jgi:predicted O-methyltransferase YrrM
LGVPERDQRFLGELVDRAEEFEPYRRLVLDELSDVPLIEIASVVSADYVFDFTILYESLLESWALFPFRLHAYALDDEAQSRLAEADLAGVEVHRTGAASDDSWHENAAQKVALVERSGLDRCLVSDVDNIFVQETPELFLLLERFDFTFIASPWPDWPIQTNIWGFRRNERSRNFAREWARRAAGRRFSDASGLPFALLERDPELKVKVVARPVGPGQDFAPAPYDFQVNRPQIAPRSDTLGFKHAQVGRAKIVHLGSLRAEGNESVAARIDAMIARYPQCAEFLPYYVTLANRAAGKLGMQTLPEPVRHLQRELDEAGVLVHRRQLATLLNRRGLLGKAVEVGVQTGFFSEFLLSHWRGAHLLSVDPWSEAAADEYSDVANRSQAEHDRAYERTMQRLARFGERSSVWRTTSVEAAARIPPGSLDFVYIDARHDYEAVMEDLEAWFDKVRPGGILAGHDYLDGDLPEGVFGVKSAVDEFFAAKRLQVRTTYVDAPWLTWFVEIPG